MPIRVQLDEDGLPDHADCVVDGEFVRDNTLLVDTMTSWEAIQVDQATFEQELRRQAGADSPA